MNRVRVLLVDDDQKTRKMLAMDLKAYGCKVYEASDGQEALDMATNRQVKFDILVTDWQMPYKLGDELIEELKKTGFGQPMILWTANRILPDCQSATMVLSKSIGLTGIVNAIRQCLQGSKP
jgi:CheY-like chemotaxis protein